jgi:REase_AHJR-like protein
MTTSIDYLEAAKIEELSSQLRGEGYSVNVHPSGADEGYDIVAEKDNKKVAVEVTVNARLRESAETIKALRRRSLEQGYYEFRLVVVSPPHETKVDIEGLDKKLCEHLSENPPDALKNGPQSPRIESVRELEIDSISVTAEGTRVTGNGVVRVWETGGVYVTNIPRELLQGPTNLPFGFEIKLDNELRITDAYRIDVDTSSWLDEG